MDLNLKGSECQVNTSSGYYKSLDIFISDADTSMLDIEEVAKEIKIGTFLDAHGEETVLDYLKEHYSELFENK